MLVHHTQQLGGGRSKQTLKTFQFGINYQSNLIEDQPKKPMDGLITSLLDEDFYNTHVSLFDDLKIQNSLLIMAHGQVVSMYHMLTREWHNFFNTSSVSNSNKQTKSIPECNEHEGGELNSSSSSAGSSEEEGQVELRSKNAVSDHCYFNKKPYEVSKVSFMSQKRHNCFDFLICMQNGRVRKVTIIFPGPRRQGTRAVLLRAETASDSVSLVSRVTKVAPAQRVEYQPPKILC